jgi:predicted nucleic acid-binding protein
MILIDTSVWIDHLHATEHRLVELLDRGQVAQHPMVIGELALGTIRDRERMLGLLADLPGMPVASHIEVMVFIGANELHGQGLSLVDAHLLASVMLSPGSRLWTRDKRLSAAARRFGVEHS